jgi:hypothetical protein
VTDIDLEISKVQQHTTWEKFFLPVFVILDILLLVVVGLLVIDPLHETIYKILLAPIVVAILINIYMTGKKGWERRERFFELLDEKHAHLKDPSQGDD